MVVEALANNEINQPTYIFPKKVAKGMLSFKQKTQYEAQMLSTTLLTFGVALSAVYFLIYIDFALWYKVILIINAIAGVVLLGMATIGGYQQYVNFMAALEFQKQMNPETFTEPHLDIYSVKRIRKISATIFIIIGLAILVVGYIYTSSFYLAIPVLLGVASIFYGFRLIKKTNEFIKKNQVNFSTQITERREQ